MATQIICDFKENDKSNPCGTPAVWRIWVSIFDTASPSTTHNVLGVDSCGQHVAQLTAGRISEATKADLGARAVAALGAIPSALGRTVSKVDPTKVKLREITISPYTV